MLFLIRSYRNNWYAKIHGEATLYAEWLNPHNFNRYLYCNNNPVRYVDPLGGWTVSLFWNANLDLGIIDKGIAIDISIGINFGYSRNKGFSFGTNISGGYNSSGYSTGISEEEKDFVMGVDAGITGPIPYLMITNAESTSDLVGYGVETGGGFGYPPINIDMGYVEGKTHEYAGNTTFNGIYLGWTPYSILGEIHSIHTNTYGMGWGQNEGFWIGGGINGKTEVIKSKKEKKEM